MLSRFLQKKRLTVVLYHGVDEPRQWGSYNYRGKFITPTSFDRQLTYFKRHYAVLPLDEAVEHLAQGTLPDYALAITFDDGYRNNYTHAFPLLKQHGLPATIFVTTDFVDAQQPLWVDRLEYAINACTHPRTTTEKIALDTAQRTRLKRLPDSDRLQALMDLETTCGARLSDFSGERAVYAPLSWDELREMAAHDIMVGAHTRTHPILSSLTDAMIRDEVVVSTERIRAELGTVSSVFAYPNGQPGDFNEAVIGAVRNSGFIGALTTIPQVNTTATDRYRLGRYTLDATDDDARFRVIVSGAKQALPSLIHSSVNHAC